MKSDKTHQAYRLRTRKLFLRLEGWEERGNRNRNGNHWINSKYGKGTFSLREAETIERIRKQKEEAID